MALTRSEQMARITAKNTGPEMELRRVLALRGIAHSVLPVVEGFHPDLTLFGGQVTVWLDGCFWHGCPDHYVCPRTRADFWALKLRKNVDRDRRQTLALEAAGFTVVRIWEHEVVNDPEAVADRLVRIGAGEAVVDPGWHVVRVEPLTDDGAREQRDLEALRHGNVRLTVERRRTTTKARRQR